MVVGRVGAMVRWSRGIVLEDGYVGGLLEVMDGGGEGWCVCAGLVVNGGQLRPG